MHWGTSWFPIHPNQPSLTCPWHGKSMNSQPTSVHHSASSILLLTTRSLAEGWSLFNMQSVACCTCIVNSQRLADWSASLSVESIETEGDTFEGEIVVKMGDTWRVERMHMDSSPCHLEFQLLFPQLSDHAYTCIDEFKSSLSKWSPKEKKNSVPIKKQKLTHTEMSRGDSFLCAVIFGRFPCLLVTCCSLGAFSCVWFAGLGSWTLTQRSHPGRNQLEDETGREGSL